MNRTFCAAFLLGSLALYGQDSAPGSKRQALPDLDARDFPGASTSSRSQEIQASGILERRQNNIKSFVAAANATTEGTRLVVNRHGIPKLFFRDGQALSSPSAQEPETIARNFLRDNAGIFPFTVGEIDGLRLVRKDVTPDATFLAFNQTLDGIDVFEGQIKFTLNTAGEVVQASAGDVMPELGRPSAPRLNAEGAVRAALRSIGSDALTALAARPVENAQAAFANPLGDRYNPITAELSIFLLDSASPRTAYRVFLEADADHAYEIMVDAEDGRVLYRHNQYVFAAQARVWPQSPAQGSRQLVTFPAGWLPASALVTTGNNADAYLDVNSDDRPDSTSIADMLNGRAYSASQVFDFPFGDGLTGLDPRNFQPAAVTNCFYFLNAAHDYYYDLGFTEAAGNFQTDNFGKGGKGGDPVLGEAQQGRAIDNAGFVPTVEGTSPRLILGLFTRNTTARNDDLDAAFDGPTVIHEYGHGVSDRLVGAGTSTSCLIGIQSGALSEGWSDYFAISYYNNPVFSPYLEQNFKIGARRQSYEGYIYTYEDLGNGPDVYEAHDDGEIWAGALWDVRKELGQSVADRLVVAGLKSTPCHPSMTDARDAILMADQATNKGANRAKLWQVFARHGLGYSAAGTDGSIVTGVRYDASYDQPPDIQTAKNPAITSRPQALGTPGLGDSYSYSVAASNPNNGVLKYELTQGPSGMTVDPASGAVRWRTTFTGQRVKITVTDGMGGKVIHGYFIPVQTNLERDKAVSINGSQGSIGFASIDVPAGVPVLQVSLREGTGDADMAIIDPSGAIRASARTGTNETLSVANPKTGRWQIFVSGYRGYAAVSLRAALITPTLLSGNTTLSDLNGVAGSETFFKVTIPAGATLFTVSTSGGTGDADLLLRKGSAPVCQATLAASTDCVFDNVSSFAGNAESILVRPAAADWYINVLGYASYSGVKLTTMLTAPPTLMTGGALLTFDATESGAAPVAQNVALFEPTGSTFSWTGKATTVSGGNWLQFTPNKGSGNTTVKVSVDQSGLKPGAYDGSIDLEAQGLASSPLTVRVKLNITARPVLVLGASALAFAAVPGKDPAPQTVTITNAGGGTLNWNVTATTTSGGDWLQTSVSRGTGTGTVQVSVNAASLTAGSYSGTLTVTSGGADKSPAAVQVTLVVARAAPSVVNAASNLAGPLSPGELVVLFVAKDVGPPVLAAARFNTAGLVDTLTGETRVLFDGTPGPMVYAVAGQISAVVPYGVKGPSVKVQVEYQGALTQAATVQVAQVSPAIFTSDSSGSGPAVVVNEDGTLNSADHPAPKGSVVLFYANGGGETNPAGVDGKLNDLPLPMPEQNVVIGIGDKGAEILYAGSAPGFVAGILQVNVRIPADAPVGDKVALVIAVGTEFSPKGVTIAIQ